MQCTAQRQQKAANTSLLESRNLLQTATLVFPRSIVCSRLSNNINILAKKFFQAANGGAWPPRPLDPPLIVILLRQSFYCTTNIRCYFLRTCLRSFLPSSVNCDASRNNGEKNVFHCCITCTESASHWTETFDPRQASRFYEYGPILFLAGGSTRRTNTKPGLRQ